MIWPTGYISGQRRNDGRPRWFSVCIATVVCARKEPMQCQRSVDSVLLTMSIINALRRHCGEMEMQFAKSNSELGKVGNGVWYRDKRRRVPLVLVSWQRSTVQKYMQRYMNRRTVKEFCCWHDARLTDNVKKHLNGYYQMSKNPLSNFVMGCHPLLKG